jgi:PAS domain S-box-containing protein
MRQEAIMKALAKIQEDSNKIPLSSKQMEQALRESEERYRLLAENVSDIIFRMDMNLEFTYISPSGSSIQASEDPTKMPIADLLAPESLEVVAKALREEVLLESTGNADSYRSRNMELQLIHKDKSTRWVEVSAGFIRDREGKATGILGILRDITVRKKAVELLWQSEQQFRTSLESAPDSVYMNDLEGNFIYGNRKAEEMTGYSREELIGKNFLELGILTAESVTRAAEVLQNNRSGKATGPDELELIRKDGSRVCVEINTSLLQRYTETVVLAFARDITERKRVEAEMKELEHKAQIASRLSAIGEMAAGIAHEINNPLSPIIGFSELLLKEALTETVKSNLYIIRSCANQVADVTKGLLIFARQLKPERTVCNINEIVATTIQLMDYHLKTNCINVIRDYDRRQPQTMADVSQLQQVVLNIIMNAEYEMKKARGGGNLTIKTETKNNMIRILFIDDGPGIPREHMEKLFQPFFTTKKSNEGTGLGLSVCYGIVAEHNGRIYAESKEGDGATFIVELPIVRLETIKQETSSETKLPEPDAGKAVEAVSDKAGPAAPARILVVDDESWTRQLLRQVLTEEGYEVETTDQALDVLRLINSGKRYALILLDIKLPDMNGIELYQHLCKIAGSFAQRIIFITGDVIGMDTMDFLAQDEVSYLSKPFDIERLKKEIKSKITKITARLQA